MTFWQLTVPTSPDTADGLTNFLWDHGALGVVEEEGPSTPARLRAFFPATASSTGLLGAVNAYRSSLRSLGFSLADTEAEIAPLLDGAWATAWQQSFPPIEVGARLLVLPPWEERPEEWTGRVPVIIEPGRAFGTGHHGSTAGCLALVEQALSLPRRAGSWAMLDIGTGSGILAIAAIKLGAPAVLAIDVDPDAVAAARLNAARNGCAERIALAIESPERLPVDAPFALVVANLLAHTHLALLPTYARLVSAGGALVLGGILAEEHDRVADAAGSAGFEPRTDLVVDGWASSLLIRPEGP